MKRLLRRVQRMDVDALAEVGSYAEYASFGNRLRAQGFREDTREDAPVCRWIHEDKATYVMPLDEKVRGSSNRCYRGGWLLQSGVDSARISRPV
jgi:hypothetical protein